MNPTITTVFMLSQDQVRDILERFLAGEIFPKFREAYGIDSKNYLHLLRLYRFKPDDGGEYVNRVPVNDEIKLTVQKSMYRHQKHFDAAVSVHRSKSLTPLLDLKNILNEPYREPIERPIKARNMSVDERNQLIVAGYSSGKTQGELGSEFGMNPQSIGGVLRKHGIGKPLKLKTKQSIPPILTPLQISKAAAMTRLVERRRQAQLVVKQARKLAVQMAPKVDRLIPSIPENSRAAQMISAYKAGSTHEQIAKFFGLSRTRVSQVLIKYGISRKDRQKAETPTARKHREAGERRMANEAKIWGCVGDEYLALIKKHGPLDGNSNMSKYLHQRHNAKVSNQEWYFTFKTWLGMLDLYGHWDEQGLANGSLKIMRIRNKNTPYSPQTCRIEPGNAKAPNNGRFKNYVINDASTHFEKLGLTSEEYCRHIAVYGDHRDLTSPISQYLRDEIAEENPSCSVTLTFKEWWDIWGSSCKPINSL